MAASASRRSSATSSSTRCSTPATAAPLLVAARTGHLGPTVFRSDRRRRDLDRGARPPAFATGDRSGASARDGVLADARPRRRARRRGTPAAPRRRACSAPTTAATPGRRSTGWNDHPMWETWCEWPEENTPDGSMLHSVHRRPARPGPPLPRPVRRRRVRDAPTAATTGHRSTRACAADFFPDPDPEFGHDPHCVRLHPLTPDRLYQQNHCGIYRIDRPDGRVDPHRRQHAPRDRRHRLPDRAAPPRPRHRVGVPDGRHRRVAAHQRRRPAGRLRHPRRGRVRWTRAGRAGCPSAAWFTVKRQAMTTDDGRPGRRVLRHDQRRGVGERRRGRVVDAASPGTCPRSTRVEVGVTPMQVRIPTPLRSYTDQQAVGRRRRARRCRSCSTTSTGSSPGIRFRMVDEQGRLRQHMKRLGRPGRRCATSSTP